MNCDVLFVVRQLEQQVKSILDAIAVNESRKKELIRGDAVDKAEQLSKLEELSVGGRTEALQVLIIDLIVCGATITAYMSMCRASSGDTREVGFF